MVGPVVGNYVGAGRRRRRPIWLGEELEDNLGSRRRTRDPRRDESRTFGLLGTRAADFDVGDRVVVAGQVVGSQWDEHWSGRDLRFRVGNDGASGEHGIGRPRLTQPSRQHFERPAH
jgi:hypothetical protein